MIDPRETLYTRQYDKLHVNVYDTAEIMGNAAACAIAEDMKRIISEKGSLRMMFAAAPSQNTTIRALLVREDIPWEKVTAFHMDEYLGISEESPQSFRNFLSRSLFSKKRFCAIHLITGDAPDAQAEADRYEALLREEPLDMVLLGIGENGHIAFNDPPDASFTESSFTKIIALDMKSRVQQVHDGCFTHLEDVPKRAITVTIPAFMQAKTLHCVVPNGRKADAIQATVLGPVAESCPASILRTHDDAHLYLDRSSAEKLLENE